MERSSSVVPACRYRLPECDEADDHIECTDGSCQSCAAVLVASCVGLSCCPCAVVNMLTLTLVKVPWAVSRRCLALLKRKRDSLKRRRRVRDHHHHHLEGEGLGKMGELAIMGRDMKSLDMKKFMRRSEWGAMDRLDMMMMIEAEDEGVESAHKGWSSRFESERMWMEMYQIGHWGFGRESFSGNLRELQVGGRRSLGASQNAPITFGELPDGFENH